MTKLTIHQRIINAKLKSLKALNFISTNTPILKDSYGLVMLAELSNELRLIEESIDDLANELEAVVKGERPNGN